MMRLAFVLAIGWLLWLGWSEPDPIDVWDNAR
jgi:hypothetical protein